MALLYKFRPRYELLSAFDVVSRFHGFETITAADSGHLDPSSPKYYMITECQSNPWVKQISGYTVRL